MNTNSDSQIHNKFAHLRVFQGKSPQESESILNIARTFVELYRGIYPFMSIGERDRLMELVLKPTVNGEKVPKAANLAHMMVSHHMDCLSNGGIPLPQDHNFSQADAETLEPFRRPMALALRPNPEKLNRRRETRVLEAQLRKIPSIDELLSKKNPFDLFSKWVEGNTQKGQRQAAL